MRDVPLAWRVNVGSSVNRTRGDLYNSSRHAFYSSTVTQFSSWILEMQEETRPLDGICLDRLGQIGKMQLICKQYTCTMSLQRIILQYINGVFNPFCKAGLWWWNRLKISDFHDVITFCSLLWKLWRHQFMCGIICESPLLWNWWSFIHSFSYLTNNFTLCCKMLLSGTKPLMGVRKVEVFFLSQVSLILLFSDEHSLWGE